MKAPFHLRKLSTAHAASALLLPDHATARLLELCVRIGADTMPTIYRVADGFLLKLHAPTRAAFPGVVRLRGLADHLLLPVDAELLPTLLEDEATALVSQRGLVFLPGGRVLAFDPQRPLAMRELLDAGAVVRNAWQPLPDAPPLASLLRSITLELPPEPDLAILNEGGDDIGVEPPQPTETGAGANALSAVQADVGRGLMGLGKMLGLGGLANLGAGMVQRAVERAPSLMQKLFGQQDAAMRWLLQQFQSGNLDDALRRAIPIGEEGGRGYTPSTLPGLPLNSLLYSLQSILGAGGGRRTVIMSRDDLVSQLMEQYRKAAERAAQQGDYRRAAFIYGKLLRDYRAAANVLLRGGLHHDAAILFLMRVNDKHAAARAFAAGGEFDRALDLYRELGDHLAAAELLRQLGDEETAIAEYRLAAEKLVSEKRDYLAAGDLMLKKAHARPEAETYYQAGWDQRPQDNAVPCALRLARLHAEEGKAGAFLALLDQADAHFARPWDDLSAGQFYNETAKLAETPHLTAIRADVRDRALLGLAHKLRQRADVESRPGQLVSTLFGSATAWSPAQVADAQVAWKTALKKQGRDDAAIDPAVTLLRVGHGTVTATCLASARGTLFVGFADGQVAAFSPSSGSIHRISYGTGFLVSPVISLAVDADGAMLAVLRGHHASPRVLSVYVVRGEGQFLEHNSLTIHPVDAWLAPTIAGRDGHLLGFWDGQSLRFLESAHLIPAGSLALPDAAARPSSALLLSNSGWNWNRSTSITTFVIEGATLWCSPRGGGPMHGEGLGWTPAIPKGSSLRSFAPSWFRAEPNVLELAGLTADGVLNWSDFNLHEGIARVRVRHVLTGGDRYLAAALVRSGFVAAVWRGGVDWVRCRRRQVKVTATTRVALPAAVACFASLATDELLIVCQDGTLARVPIPQ